MIKRTILKHNANCWPVPFSAPILVSPVDQKIGTSCCTP